MLSLELSDVAHYLLGRGLVTRRNVVDGDLVIVDVSRRNRNFKVQRRRQPSLFVKQVRAENTEATESLRCEADCYRLAQSDPAFAALEPLVPGLWHYDARNHILVVELIEGCENLRERHLRLGGFSPEIGEQLGSSIGHFHGAMAPSGGFGTDAFAHRTPWILSLDAQPEELGAQPGPLAQLYRILRQYPEFSSRLNDLRAAWRVDCLIHGDLKWDNCLVSTRDESAELNLKIVDWELADVGDACWDLGGILAAYLSSWVFSMPEMGLTPAGVLVERAQYRLDDMQPAIAAFWRAYKSTRRIDDESARELLERSIRYGAARLVQTAYEISMHGEELTAPAVRLLQLSENILASPQEAVAHLLAA